MLRTVRGVLADQLLNFGLLGRIQQALLIRLAPARLAHQALRALGRARSAGRY
jgi:hypothetical protein